MLQICVIAKNEARYLPEWIEYHLMIGFDKIYLYDNGSEDDIASACAPYDRVQLINWPIRGGQQKSAYIDYLRRFSSEAEWTAFIDADEFICYRGQGNLRDYLAAADKQCAGLEVQWVIFDCNDHAERPSGLVLKNYTRAHSVAPQRNIKSICRPSCIDFDRIRSPHRFPYVTGFHVRSTEIPELSIFHYMLRSRADVLAKVLRGDAWSLETERKRLANVDNAVQSILDKYDNADTNELHMLKYVPVLEEALAMRFSAELSTFHLNLRLGTLIG